MLKILKEAKKADEKYGNFNSTHELYAVLQEEVEEFWDLVKMKPDPNKSAQMVEELTQIAAIAVRGIRQLDDKQIKHV